MLGNLCTKNRTGCILFSINQTLGKWICVSLLLLPQRILTSNIIACKNWEEIFLDHLVLFKINKAELARTTQAFRAHRIFQNAYSVKGLAYVKRPNDSQGQNKQWNGPVKFVLTNMICCLWRTSTHTHKAHKQRQQPEPKV